MVTKARRIRIAMALELEALQETIPNLTGKLCPYCTNTMIANHPKLMPTRDHIRPRSKYPVAGRLGRTIVVCCECNFMKKDLTLTQFVDLLRSRNAEFQRSIDKNNERIDNISYLLQIGIDKE